MLEIVEGPLDNAIPENVIEIEDEVKNQKPGNPKVNNNDENDDEMRSNEHEITGVHEEDDNNESSGKRKKAKNPSYFNEEIVNKIISIGGIKMKKPSYVKYLTREMCKG